MNNKIYVTNKEELPKKCCDFPYLCSHLGCYEDKESMSNFKGNKIREDCPISLTSELTKSLEEKIEILEQENEKLKKRLEKAIELPCKIGDTIYYVNGIDKIIPIAEGIIIDIRMDFNKINSMNIDVDCGNRYMHFNNDKDCLCGFTCHLADINYKWFLTREKAEETLKQNEIKKGVYIV